MKDWQKGSGYVKELKELDQIKNQLRQLGINLCG
jgi:hypothetical protein